MIAVSVVMPVYNAEKYLSVAIESLLQQSLKNIEIICVDDGSTDGSYEILLKYQKIDSRIRILTQENKYAGIARNYGMSVARGKYLSFLDADDYFHPTMLEEAYFCAEKELADVVVFGGNVFTDNPQEFKAVNYFLKEELLPSGDSFLLKDNKDYVFNFTNTAPWNKLFLREYIVNEKLQFQPSKRANDVYFVVMAIASAKKIAIVRKSLISYRIENQNSLQGTNYSSPLQFSKAFLAAQEKILEKNLYEEYGASFQNLCLSNCIYNLDSLLNGEAFEELYMELKNNLFQKFNIQEITKIESFNKYALEQYNYIMSHTALDYWVNKYVKNKSKKIVQYLFPFHRIEKGANIILYAAGNVGKSYFRQIKKTNYCNILHWVDKKQRIFGESIVEEPDQIKWNNNAYVVVAVEKVQLYEEIKKMLILQYEINEEKIIWESPQIEADL